MTETSFKHDKCSLLITGANGFVGRPLCAELLARGYMVKAAVRTAGTLPEIAAVSVVGEIDGGTRWAEALNGVDVVIHLAARVHVMHENAGNPLAEFRRVNTEGTEHLARSAAANGVRRLGRPAQVGRVLVVRNAQQ